MANTEYELKRPTINGKQSRSWYIVWYEGRKQYRRSTGKEDLREAERFLASFIALMSKPQEGFTVSDIITSYNQARAEKHGGTLPPSTAYVLKAVERLLGGYDPQDLQRPVIDKFRQTRKREAASGGTITTELTYLRAALNWAIKGNWMEKAPHIEIPKAAPARKVYFTKEQFQRLYEATETPHMRAFLALGVWTGQRKAALLGVRWSDIHGGLVWFKQTDVANKRRAHAIPLTAPLALALGEAYALRDSDYVVSWNGKPVTDPKKAFRRSCERAGLGDFRIHDLRRTFASWSLQAGANIYDVASALQDDIKIVQKHYGHLSPDHLNDLMGKLTG